MNDSGWTEEEIAAAMEAIEQMEAEEAQGNAQAQSQIEGIAAKATPDINDMLLQAMNVPAKGTPASLLPPQSVIDPLKPAPGQIMQQPAPQAPAPQAKVPHFSAENEPWYYGHLDNKTAEGVYAFFNPPAGPNDASTRHKAERERIAKQGYPETQLPEMPDVGAYLPAGGAAARGKARREGREIYKPEEVKSYAKSYKDGDVRELPNGTKMVRRGGAWEAI